MNDTKTAYESSHPAGDESGGSLLGHIWASIAATVVLGVIVCGIYPLIVYGIGQVVFPNQANGSLVKKDGTPTTDDTQAAGSSLIGQSFSAACYFHPRPSAANNSAGASYSVTGGYDATSSGGTNYGPLSDILINGENVSAPPPATAPATTAAIATQPATTSAATTATAATSTAPATQPAMVLGYDGVRLRVIHYCLDNNIAFKLYQVKFDSDGNIIASSKTELSSTEKLKFIAPDGTANDVALVDAFPHMDMSGKVAIIAADFATLIPADAVTASGSGLDPHISPANAELQARRIADARKLSKDKVLELIKQNTDQPNLGILGDPGVNVLMLNIALDKAAPMPAPSSAPTSAPESASAPASATAPATTLK